MAILAILPCLSEEDPPPIALSLLDRYPCCPLELPNTHKEEARPTPKPLLQHHHAPSHTCSILPAFFPLTPQLAQQQTCYEYPQVPGPVVEVESTHSTVHNRGVEHDSVLQPAREGELE